MSKEFDTLFYIGRFQPLHNGHFQILADAARKANHVRILAGSSNAAISPRNPWTFDQRREMILAACMKLHHDYGADFDVWPLDDYTYNDNKWLAMAHPYFESEKGKVGLIGYKKDRETAAYLDMFQIPGVEANPNWVLSSTDIRESFLCKVPQVPYDLVPMEIATRMRDFIQTEQFKYLLDWSEFIRHYDAKLYPITICCVDAVVIQNGHILLVTRKKQPGQGLLALPGGHVEKDEKFVDAAVRELKEETRITDGRGEIPPAMLKSFIRHNHFFDNPHRSLHGRVVTMAYYFDVPTRKEMFKVRGDDDAEAAKWYKLGTLNPRQFHDDHWHIIQEMIRPTEI